MDDSKNGPILRFGNGARVYPGTKSTSVIEGPDCPTGCVKHLQLVLGKATECAPGGPYDTD